MNGDPGYIQDTAEAVKLWPDSASTFAPTLDLIFYGLTAATLVILLALTGLILFYSIRYRAGSKADRSSSGGHSLQRWIEIGWAVPTLLIFLGFFGWAATAYLDAYRTPAGAATVNVIAKQWMWKVQHENGVREINELHLPVGEKIRLRMTSQDVIHSFSIPAFRVKRDVLPESYTSAWLEATRPGVYSLFCAEYCGLDHSRMRGRIVAMTPEDYEAWLARQEAPAAPAVKGRQLFAAYGCGGCHGAGSTVHAPDLAGIYGRPVQLQGGGTVIADDDYIRDSILLPTKHVVAGYAPVMPSFKGQASEADILALAAYIRALGETENRRTAR